MINLHRQQISMFILLSVTVGVDHSFCASPELPIQYEYDTLGNRTRASNLIQLTDSAIVAVEPSTGVAGKRINIYGRNLPWQEREQVLVSFNGITTTPMRMSDRVILAEIPDNTSTGPLTVILPGGLVLDAGTIEISGVVVMPRRAVVVGAQTLQFQAEVVSVAHQKISWELLPGTLDDTVSLGSITTNGLYTPPSLSDPNAAHLVRVRATSPALDSRYGTSFVTVLGHVGAQPPADVLIPGLTPMISSGNVVIAQPKAEVLLPDWTPPLTLGAVTIAQPVAEVLLPGWTPPMAVGSILVTQPPVDVFLPDWVAPMTADSVTVAFPPVDVQIEDE